MPLTVRAWRVGVGGVTIIMVYSSREIAAC